MLQKLGRSVVLKNLGGDKSIQKFYIPDWLRKLHMQFMKHGFFVYSHQATSLNSLLGVICLILQDLKLQPHIEGI